MISLKSGVSQLTRVSALALLAAMAPHASADQIHVPVDYVDLQDAIDAAAAYDTIIVDGGIHFPVVIDKPLSVSGVPGNMPLLMPSHPFEYPCPTILGCGSVDADPPILLAGPGSGTVVLQGLQIEGDVVHMTFTNKPSAIEGGGFDRLHIVDCTVTAPTSVLVTEPIGFIGANHGVSADVGWISVMDSTITGGSPVYSQAWDGDDLFPGGDGIHTSGDVTICNSTVAGGDAGPVSLVDSATCAEINGGEGGDGVSTTGSVAYDSSFIFGGAGSAVSPLNSPTCTMPDGAAFAVGTSASLDPTACYDTLPSPCAGATGLPTTQTYLITGAPNSADWWWYMGSELFAMDFVQVDGVSDFNGDMAVDELDQADAFADSINAYALLNGWLDMSASAFRLQGSVYLSVSSPCQPSYFWVGDLGSSVCNIATSSVCEFNPGFYPLPVIQLVPLPGVDCNQNGVDDQLDLAIGLSLDLNGNGVLDECVPSACTTGSIESWGVGSGGMVDAPSGTDFVQLATGSSHSLALRADGSILSWGDDSAGAVSETPGGTGFVHVAAGDSHSMALRADGSIVAWGNHDPATTPVGSGFVQLAGGSSHSVALRADGSIVSWGDDSWGQVSDTPAGTDFTQVTANSENSMALRADGSIASWGADWNGGVVTQTPTGAGFIQVATGRWHALALAADGSIVSWGTGVLGGDDEPPGGPGFIQVVVGYGHSMALHANGTIVVWGPPESAPTFYGVPAGSGFVQLAAYRDLSLALRGCSAWSDLGFALAGANGDPLLESSGTMTPGSLNYVELSHAAPLAKAALFWSFESAPVAFYGGTLETGLTHWIYPVATSAVGEITWALNLPASGVPSGMELHVQWAILDAGALQGVALSNALKAVTP